MTASRKTPVSGHLCLMMGGSKTLTIFTYSDRV